MLSQEQMGILNRVVVGLVALTLLLGGVFWLKGKTEILPEKPEPIEMTIPKRAFEQPELAYEAIGEPVLGLEFKPLALKLPDLRKYINYVGRNSRPDADPQEAMLNFTVMGSMEPLAAKPGEKLYLIYDKNRSPAPYYFSPENAPTNLWMEGFPDGGGALVQVGMVDSEGQLVDEPEENAKFEAKEKQFARFGGGTWQLDGMRVDGTLLSRQRARWAGVDQFLERHGGEEFANCQGKERIDFGEGADRYSVYVGVGEALAWDQGKWRRLPPGPETVDKPLLVVKSVEDRLMKLELWDVEGRRKAPMNLLRIGENWSPQALERDFNYVGARTHSQYLFEIGGRRMELKPKDWLLKTDEGWVRLSTPQQIDDYVDRRLVGPLVVFEGVEKVDEGLSMRAWVYSPNRTSAEEVLYPLLKGAGGVRAVTHDEETDESSSDWDDSSELDTSEF